MMIKINCENQNKKRKVDLIKIKRVVRNTLRKLKRKNAEINIVFLSNQKIRAMNRRYLGKDASTDVIAFSMEDNISRFEGRGPLFLGDIAISTDTAVQNAEE
jgi:probable rRNA maturation factor